MSTRQQEPTCPPFRDEYMCPIGHGIMREPVIARDGYMYERHNIYNWFVVSGSTRSPMTNIDMNTTTVFPVNYLQSQIKDWLQLIKNKTVPDDIKEMVDAYYEPMEDVSQIQLNMTTRDNNYINMSVLEPLEHNSQEQSPTPFGGNDLIEAGYPPNVELFRQETDVEILDEIERMMIINEQNISQNEMFSMFNSSERVVT